MPPPNIVPRTSVLDNRHRSEWKRSLHGQRDPVVSDLMGSQTIDPRTVEPNAAACRPLQPDDELQQRALSGPVRTDDGDDVAVVDPECHAVDGRETAEAFCDRVNLEEQVPPPTLGRRTIGSQGRRLEDHSRPEGGRSGVQSGLRRCALGQDGVLRPRPDHLAPWRPPERPSIAGDVEGVRMDIGGDSLRLGPTLLIASATILTYA